jgi:oligosaccharide repeat unit polymerase
MDVYGWGQALRVCVALVLAASLIASGLLTFQQHPDLGLTGLLASIALLCAAAPIYLRRRYDVGEPATLIVLSVLIGATVRTLFLLMSNSDEANSFLLLNQPVEILLKASIYVVLGLAAYAAGYLCVTRRSPSRYLQFVSTHWQWDERRFLILVTVFILISLISMWLFYRQFAAMILIETLGDFSSKRFASVDGGEYRTAYGYLRWGASLSSTALLFLTISLASRTRQQTPLKIGLLVVATVAVLGFAFFTSKRLELAVVFGGAGIAFLYVRGKIAASVVTALVIVMLCLFMLITALRSQAASLEEATSGVSMTEVLEIFAMDRHFVDISKTALIQQEFNGFDDHLYGTSYLALITAPVPRLWWPEKPSMQLGSLVGQRVYGHSPGGAGVPPGMLGELWINFGWTMLLPGMFMMGFILRYLYHLFDGIRTLPNGTLLYIGSMIPLTWGLSNRNVTASIIDMVMSLVPILLGIWLISRPVTCVIFPIGDTNGEPHENGQTPRHHIDAQIQ